MDSRYGCKNCIHFKEENSEWGRCSQVAGMVASFPLSGPQLKFMLVRTDFACNSFISRTKYKSIDTLANFITHGSPRYATLKNLFYTLSTLTYGNHIPKKEVLDGLIKDYPEFETELRDFSIALALDALHDVARSDDDDPPNTKITPGVAKAIDRFHKKLEQRQS